MRNSLRLCGLQRIYCASKKPFQKNKGIFRLRGGIDESESKSFFFCSTGSCVGLFSAFARGGFDRNHHRSCRGRQRRFDSGVEVTITSPAMIGGARSAITDEQGTYRFTLLAVGVYRVTFALQGFKTLNIDGAECHGRNERDDQWKHGGFDHGRGGHRDEPGASSTWRAATVGVNWGVQKFDRHSLRRQPALANVASAGIPCNEL